MEAQSCDNDPAGDVEPKQEGFMGFEDRVWEKE
jgi:hypothetical protein